MPKNEDRLREVGVIRADTLDAHYQAIVDGLTPTEVDVIVALQTRIAEADRVADLVDPDGGAGRSDTAFMPL
jgi:ethanolamine utilization microcompartment shell protein EutL